MRTPTLRIYPNLLAWRKAHTLTTRAAAEKLGMSQSAYSRLERGVRATKGKQAKDLMLKTGVPLEVLVGAA